MVSHPVPRFQEMIVFFFFMLKDLRFPYYVNGKDGTASWLLREEKE